MDNKKLTELLEGIPPVHLKLLTLAEQLTLPNGELDIEAASKRIEEAEEAAAEAQGYSSATRQLSRRMQWLLNHHPA